MGADDGSKQPELPNFVFSDLDEKFSVELEHFRGCPVLLTFWASWCAPCRYELPELEKLQDELEHSGLVLLAVNVDRSPLNARKFLDRLDLDVPVVLMTHEDLQVLQVGKLPTTVLIDADGHVVKAYEGYVRGMGGVLKEQIETLLAAQTVGDADANG